MDIVTLGPTRCEFRLGMFEMDLQAERDLTRRVTDCLKGKFNLIEHEGLEVLLEYVGDVCFFEECDATIHIARYPTHISILRVEPVY